MFKKEEINKFRINIGEVGREGDILYFEVEYEKVVEGKVNIEYYLSYYGCGLIEFQVGYEINNRVFLWGFRLFRENVLWKMENTRG